MELVQLVVVVVVVVVVVITTFVFYSLPADHIEYIRDIAGIDHVGIGSDFDGIPK